MAQHEGMVISDLFAIINEATKAAKAQLIAVKNKKDEVSIGDMFEMQMLMNRLSQLSEMSTQVISASHTAISSMARNVKG